MGKPYSMGLRERVVRAVQDGLSCRQAAARFAVGISTVIRWVRRQQETGTVARRRVQWTACEPGRPSCLVFIVETWSKTNIAPLRGWAPRGQRLKAKVPMPAVEDGDRPGRLALGLRRGALAPRRADQRRVLPALCRQSPRADPPAERKRICYRAGESHLRNWTGASDDLDSGAGYRVILAAQPGDRPVCRLAVLLFSGTPLSAARVAAEGIGGDAFLA